MLITLKRRPFHQRLWRHYREFRRIGMGVLSSARWALFMARGCSRC